MRVGDEIAVRRIDDHAGARAPEFALTLLRVRRQAEEAAKSRVVEEGIARGGDRAAYRDVDHRGRGTLDHRREGGQRGLRENRGGKGERGASQHRREEFFHGMQPRWGAISDRAKVSQVPVRASLDFPACGRAGGQTVRILCDLDRKSTRLNSSHLVISYAVFCLKKKKIDNYQTRI